MRVAQRSGHIVELILKHSRPKALILSFSELINLLVAAKHPVIDV